MITILNKKQILKEKGVLVSCHYDNGEKYHIYSYTNPNFCLYVTKDKNDLLNKINTYSDSVFFNCGVNEIKLNDYFN